VKGRKTGATLLLALLLLSALGLLALVAAGEAVLQQRLAANDGVQAAQRVAADSALVWAESWLLGLDPSVRPQPHDPDCANCEVLYASSDVPAAPEFESADWWQTQGYPDGHDPVTGLPVTHRGIPDATARFIIEELEFRPADPAVADSHDTSFYRIIARAPAGVLGGEPVVVASILARPWGEASWRNDFPATTDRAGFCRGPDIHGPCGRLAWQQRR
jgi:hypothetical protein